MSLDRLIENIIEKQNPTVAGLDPKLSYIPTYIKESCFEKYGHTLEGAAAALFEFNKGLIDALHTIVPVSYTHLPSIRATLGECFDMPIGTNVKGKMVAALRRLGVDKVFDTDFGADLTIMEEAHEFIHRVKTGGVLPMITSCSPGWVKFCEDVYKRQTQGTHEKNSS